MLYTSRIFDDSCFSSVLQRITEQAGVVLSLDPKPIEVSNKFKMLFLPYSVDFRTDKTASIIDADRVTGMVRDAIPITGKLGR